MAAKFAGFSSKAFGFFRQLEKNNDRNWFAAHKEVFESEVRGPMIELVSLICDELRGLAIDYVPEKPEKAMYRIYRDTRFSKDKTPYKTHISAHFQHRRIEKNRGAGLYFEVSHQSLGIGGGIYMPEPEQLLAMRQMLEKQWKEFAKLTSERSLVKVLGELQGESLARVPKGYDADSPAADWFRKKQFYYFVELDAKLAKGPKVYTEITSRFRKLLPVTQFMNEAILRAVEVEEEPRPVRPEPMF